MSPDQTPASPPLADAPQRDGSAPYLPPRVPLSLRSLREAWQDGSWFCQLGGFGSGYWRGQPWWYRLVTRVGWYARHFTVRPIAAWQIITAAPEHRDCGHGLRAFLIRARGVACALTGRIVHAYPMRHDLSWELASWDHATWAGAEYTCWRAKFAAVCTGRAWHLHVYEDGE